ncbi:hypothetical protein [Acidovorax sp. 1608163]|uniref:hypothetical protein n=1 Tax=Acidovorax sp. 1608163 TaxID=2478662 RepID=UPI0013CE9729|nr:hypothetical protein [Acidovorax sp. 1608163]
MDHPLKAGSAAFFPVTKGYTQADGEWIQKVLFLNILLKSGVGEAVALNPEGCCARIRCAGIGRFG